MRRWKPLCLAGLLCAATTPAFGHGAPIVLTGEDQQLKASPLVFVSEFELLAPTLLTTDLPGFGIVSQASGVPVGVDLQMQVISKLWYWNPDLNMPDDTESKLSIDNVLGETAVVDQDSTTLPPLQIASYGGEDGWHRHVDYILDPADSPPGAYGLVFELLAEPLAKSDPILVVFGAFAEGFGEDDLPGAVEGLTAAIFALPGDANRDGTVDLTDFGILKQNFGLMPATWEQGNFDDEPSVSLGDFGVLKANFGKTRGTGAAVPEPGGLALGLLGAACASALARQALPPRHLAKRRA
jgi:hypothetical protein